MGLKNREARNGLKNREARNALSEEQDTELVEDMQNEWADTEKTDVLDDSMFSDTVVLDAAGSLADNVGESSVEIDVESLVAEIEAEANEGVDASVRVRRRLDAILERKRRHEDLVDFTDYELDA